MSQGECSTEHHSTQASNGPDYYGMFSDKLVGQWLNIKNKSGPSAEPCETPKATS